MISSDERPQIEARQVAAEATGPGHYCIHMSVVLAAFAVPIPIALYFKKRIVLLGGFAYVAALILILEAAVLFGIRGMYCAAPRRQALFVLHKQSLLALRNGLRASFHFRFCHPRRIRPSRGPDR
jgi:hypothetical protein